jgi:hypothetical protein
VVIIHEHPSENNDLVNIGFIDSYLLIFDSLSSDLPLAWLDIEFWNMKIIEQINQ